MTPTIQWIVSIDPPPNLTRPPDHPEQLDHHDYPAHSDLLATPNTLMQNAEFAQFTAVFTNFPCSSNLLKNASSRFLDKCDKIGIEHVGFHPLDSKHYLLRKICVRYRQFRICQHKANTLIYRQQNVKTNIISENYGENSPQNPIQKYLI